MHTLKVCENEQLQGLTSEEVFYAAAGANVPQEIKEQNQN